MSFSKKCLFGAVIVCASFGARAGVVADFSTDFSAVSNPSGDWRYGYASSLGGVFNLDSNKTAYGTMGEVIAWSPVGTFWPTVAMNTGASQVNFGASEAIHLASQQGLLHPGSNGEFAIVRLNVMSTFSGQLQVEFAGIDVVGTTTDVHVLLNGISLFSGVINSFGQLQSFDTTQAFQLGDVIDFAVGMGSNGNYLDDSTGFKATLSTVALSAVPEPAAWTLVLCGLLGLAPLAIRRRLA